jgi:single-strand DNA-binding protein
VLLVRAMTQGFNRVTLFGHLGADPELRMTNGGTHVLSFRVATTEVYFDKEQTKQERTEWHKVALFGARAEPLSRILAKGSSVLIEGRLQTSSYEKDGSKRYTTEVIASEICLGGRAPTGAFTRPSSAPLSRPAPSQREAADDVPF